MRTLPKLLCAITLLSMNGLVWASCPEGYRENDRTGECKAIPGVAEKVEAKKEAGKQEDELAKVLASVAPGKFVKYLDYPEIDELDVIWITAPLNTEEAIEVYFKGRELDPIEGVWGDDVHYSHAVFSASTA